MTFILAIDQSTSATKAVLFDARGRVLDRAARDHRQIYPQAGWVEHDAEEIWSNVLSVLAELARRNRDKLSAAVALAITNQRETFVVFDRQTGRPLHHAIVWQCRRGEAICNELCATGHDETIRRKTGLRLDSYFPAPKLKWLSQGNPQIRRQLESGEALIGTIDSYLVYRLTRGAVFATDSTNASRTLLFDLGRMRWDEQLCQLFDVPMRALPEIRESFAGYGDTDAEGVLPSKLPIRGVMGDSQASLFAQRCYEPGTAKATFGSGTSILLNAGNRCPAASGGAVAALAWVRAGQPVYAYEGLISYSSATISWLQNQLGLLSDAAECERLAIEAGTNGGVYLVPAFAGLSAPYWKPDARAALVNMTAHTCKQHIVRAAVESIAYQIHDVLTMMRSEADVAPKVLYADGGPTRNKFLMQFTADIARVELVVADVPDCSALGAAMAGLLGSGVFRSLADCAVMPRSTTAFRPSMPGEDAARLVEGWTRAVERVF